MPHALQCRCGKLKGQVERPERANHAVCYCKDCQAFAHFLGRPDEILDEGGGSEVVQTQPRYVGFTEGAEHLACVRLTPSGLVRWYADCCKTPIGNTMATPKMSFVGLVHSCLDVAGQPLDDAFGSVRCRVNTHGAKGSPRPKPVGIPWAALWFLSMLIRARVDGSYRQTPFFDACSSPVVAPRVLSAEERRTLAEAVEAM